MNFDNFIFNLKVIRNSKQLSARELSVKCGLKQQKRIADIEDNRGRPDIDEVYTICKVLEVSIDDMLNKKVEVCYNFK